MNSDALLTIEAAQSAYGEYGFDPCESGEVEAGFEKIVLYAYGSGVTHAARQLADGTWTSKCGRDNDIIHTLDGFAGSDYGEPVLFMKRPRPNEP